MENDFTQLKQELVDLTTRFNHLSDLYYRTKQVDRDVFQNPVYFNSKIYLKDGTNISTGATTGMTLGATGDKIGFLGKTPVARQGAITSPSGGATIDSQARTAIDSIRTVLINFGFTS